MASTLDIHMIWVRDPSDLSQILWLEDAWDADSIDSNSSGWEEAVQKAYEAHGAENVRVIVGAVDFDAVENAFSVPRADLVRTFNEEDALAAEQARILSALQKLHDTIPYDGESNLAQRRGIRRAISTIQNKE